MSGIAGQLRRTDKDRAIWRGRHLVLTLTAVGAATALASLLPLQPRLVWNYTPSVPVGLYEIRQQPPMRGDLLAIDLTGEPRRLLAQAGALKPSQLLLKPLAGIAGDVACRNGLTVTLNDRVVAQARAASSPGQNLPTWSGCRVLSGDEILVIADHPASFDSRYFGPLSAADIVGVARPLLLLPSSRETG